MSSIKPKEMKAARRFRDMAAAKYLFNPRVTYIDVGWYVEPQTGQSLSGDLRVRIHIANQPREAAFESFAVHHPELVIDKERIPFPVDLVEANYRFDWFWYYPPQPTDPRNRVFTPLRGGISISNEIFYNYGTLGGVVIDRVSGDEMILSNWHVLAGSAYATTGLKIYQPGYADGGRYQNTIAHLKKHGMREGIDAAVAKLTDARPWINEQLELGRVSGVTEPMLDMHVVKSGRGSRVTEGIIDGVEGEFPIHYGGFLRKIRHVYRIVPVRANAEVSRGGDSGSWWLEKSTNMAVALHFAGYDSPETALAIAMPKVLETLKIDIV